MSFNFGKNDVKEQGGIAIFNNGKGGRVENVTLEIKKKGVDYQDEGKNKPDYQVVYTDASGASTNEGFYYLDPAKHNAQFTTFDKAVEKQWNKFASIITAAGGDPTIEAKDAKEMLDKMAILTKKAIEGASFNVFVNYGTKSNPKKYLQIRSWVPFIEAASVTEANTKLKAGNLDQIERIELPTSEGASAGGNSPAVDGWV